MNDIFTNWVAMDCFCYDIIEAWIAYRKSKGLSCSKDDYLDWLEEFMQGMEVNFADCVEEEDD